MAPFGQDYLLAYLNQGSCGFGNYGMSFGGWGSDILGGMGLGGFNIGNMLSCGMSYDAQAGFSVANAILNTAGMALESSIQSKQSTPSAKSKLESKNSEINTTLKGIASGLELKTVIDANYDASVIMSKTEEGKALQKAKDESNKQQQSVALLKTEYDKALKVQTDAENAYKEANSTDANYSQLKDAYEKSIAAAKEAKEAYEKAQQVQKAVDDAQKAYDSKLESVKKACEKLKELVEAREALQIEADDKVLDKADGKDSQRTTTSGLFDDKTGKLKDGTVATPSQVRFALNDYRNASTQSDRKKYAYQFIQLYESMSSEDQKKEKHLMQAYNLVMTHKRTFNWNFNSPVEDKDTT